jgi:hypothetical protein
MKEIEIIIEKGGIEKKIIISSGIISFNDTENSINTKYKPSTIVIAGNGRYAPPFEQGSRVLRDIRTTSSEKLNNWKLVVPLQQNENDFFKFPYLDHVKTTQTETSKNWGAWICENDSEEFPDIILINYPFWAISKFDKIPEFSESNYSELLSKVFRTIMAIISTTTSFNLKNKKQKNGHLLALSDIGNNLIDRNLNAKISKDTFFLNSIYKLRIRTFTQVLSEWMNSNDFFNKAIISYGEGARMDLVERAWDEQVEESKSDITEFGDALSIRKKNASLLSELIDSNPRNNLKNAFEMAFETLNNSTPSLAADLIQCRTLVEAISHDLCAKYDLKAQNANLFAYIQRIEESKKVSPWVTSYLHVIRQLGNEAAHYKNEVMRRPEKPVGKDLIVIHAALNRILAFYKEEEI